MLSFGGWAEDDGEDSVEGGLATVSLSTLVIVAPGLTVAGSSSFVMQESTSTSLPPMDKAEPGNNGPENAVRPMIFPVLLCSVA